MMSKFSYHSLLHSLALTLFTLILSAAYVSAQDFSSSFARTDETLEIASLAPLPSAPIADVVNLDTAFASRAIFAAPMPIIAVKNPERFPAEHPFWDRQNRILFAATAGAATADFFVTRSNLAKGGRELNPLTRPFAGSTPTLAANFALQTASVIGVSYVFHKTGHHKLERITSVVNITASTGAVVYGLTHR